MKNIHVLPTENYKQDYTLQSGEVVEVVRLGQLIKNSETNELLINKNSHWADSCDTDVLVPHHIYITSKEEIKEGDWFFDIISNTIHKAELATGVFNSRKKIILTTDLDLIKDGVQPIDDEFLEWFIKNPNCEEVEVLYDYFQVNQNNPVLRGSTSLVKQHKIIIPREEKTTEEQLPTKWLKTEQIETWIGNSDEGGRGKLIVLHQCGENKEELISQLNTMIDGLKNGFEYFAQ